MQAVQFEILQFRQYLLYFIEQLTQVPSKMVTLKLEQTQFPDAKSIENPWEHNVQAKVLQVVQE